jgi:hypothetical protein
MASLNLKDCNCVTNRNFQKVRSIYVKDKDGNIFVPWHRWNTKIINEENPNLFSNYSYYSNDIQLNNDFKTNKVLELPIEIARLLCSKMITEKEYDNIINMLKSEDDENLQVVVQVLRGYRKRRLQQSKKKKQKYENYTRTT